MSRGNLSYASNDRASPRFGRMACAAVQPVACPYCGGREIGQAFTSRSLLLGAGLCRVTQWDFGPADDDGTRLALPVTLERMASVSHPISAPFGCMSCGRGLDRYDLVVQSH
jgi:hypothetical protein